MPISRIDNFSIIVTALRLLELEMSQMITIDSNSDLEMYAVEAYDSRFTQPVEILSSDFEENNFDLLHHASVSPR